MSLVREGTRWLWGRGGDLVRVSGPGFGRVEEHGEHQAHDSPILPSLVFSS